MNTTNTPSQPALRPLLLVLVAAASIFALTMGARQSMGLFLGNLNTSTGLGLASISLAFACGQLAWGLTQPVAGLVADRWGPGRVLVLGILLVALGTWLVPQMHSTAGLIFAIGVLGAGGAGMAGPSVLMAATTRLVAPAKRAMATGVVNAGGSFGQFIFAPVAQAITTASGWVVAVHSLAFIVLLALPAAWALRGMPAAAGLRLQRRASAPARRCSRHWPTAATSCWPWAFSSAAFTSPSWPRTCPAWWPAAGWRPRWAPGRWRCWACSTSPAAWASGC